MAVIITNKKHYRRVSNEGQRVNFTVMMLCDFDKVHNNDVIVIQRSVLLYKPTKRMIDDYITQGFTKIRRFLNDRYFWMQNEFSVQRNTLEVILDDFGIGILLFQNKLIESNVKNIKDTFLRLDLEQINSKQAKQEMIDLFTRTIHKVECPTCKKQKPIYEIADYDGICEKCHSKKQLDQIMVKIREIDKKRRELESNKA